MKVSGSGAGTRNASPPRDRCLSARWWALACLVVLSAALEGAGATPEIVAAAKDGDRAAVRRLVTERADVNATEPDGTTALHWAVRANDAEMVELLLRAGASAVAANRYGVTPLRLAAINGSVPVATLLLDAGASPNTANAEGETALMTAARAGSAQLVELLAARGANVDARDGWFGETALMWAAAEDHPHVIRALARLGADVNARSTFIEMPVLEFPKSGGPNMPFARGGWTALMYAARDGSIDAARMLVELGADLNAVALPQTDVPLTEELLNNADTVGTTALVYAIINAHFDLAAMLVEAGADPDIADHTGMAALYAAVEWNTLQWVQSRPAPIWRDQMSGARLVERLLAHGADPNATLKSAPPKISLDPGATLNFRQGTTPLMRAARTNDFEVIELLLEAGADPNAALPDGTTALMIAAGQGLGGLRGEGPRIRVPTEEGAVQAVQVLLDRGANVNAASNSGNTALHAAVNRSDAIVKLLAERGADLHATNKGGQTALDIASGRGGRGGRRGGGRGGRGGQVRESTVKLLQELMAARP